MTVLQAKNYLPLVGKRQSPQHTMQQRELKDKFQGDYIGRIGGYHTGSLNAKTFQCEL